MKDEIAVVVSKEVGLSVEEVLGLIEVPPKEELGDFAFPCFDLAKSLGKSPVLVAGELTDKFRKSLPKGISGVGFEGGYVNFFVDTKILAKRVLAKDVRCQMSGVGKGKKVMIEFSQANTHKAFHVGHIRGTSIGESLARISEFMGDGVIRVNYQGDTGMHVAKWIWCYNKYHKKERLRKDESWVAGIYVDAVGRLAKNEELQEEVDEVNRKLDSREDGKLNELWKKTRKLSLDALEIIYGDLNTRFDKYYFESDVEVDGKKIVSDLVKKKIAKVDDGATIIDFDGKLSVWVLLRKDGTVLYSAKDIALAKRKFEDYDLDRSIYVVANEQNLHMVQLEETLRRMKFEDVEKINHRSFGMVRMPTGKMSSRTGDNILYSDFKKEIFEYAKKGILDRASGRTGDLSGRALKILIAVIKYSMLKQDIRKDMVFDKKKALSFEGDTGPYLLYSYARASSIVRKVKSKRKVGILDLRDAEVRLLKKIDCFWDVVSRAYENLAPNLVANYCYELASLFNEFYHSCPVLGSDEEGFRLALVKKFKDVLKEGLGLLGIETLEEM